MDRVVSATCPKCHTDLRIPAQWAEKPVRCLNCRAVVRAVGPVPAAVSVNGVPPQPVPLVFDPATNSYVPAPVPAGPESVFAELGVKRTGRRKKYKRSSGTGLVAAFFLLLFLGVGGAVAWVAVTDNPIKEKLTVLVRGGATPTTTPDTAAVSPQPATAGMNPRRMLAMSVTKYLYCNPLIGGKNKNGTSEFNEAIKALAFRWEIPDTRDNNQLFVLTDADGQLMPSAARRPMLKPIVTDTYTRFLATSRPHDRVVLYFGGHSMVKDGKGYLIPTEGDPNEAESLIPLADLWAKLAACPAQQKVVLFDVCRLSTDDNAVRPGSEPMTEELEKLLHTPPAGVQVVTSCSAGQTTGEFRYAADSDTPQGSAFLGALRTTARKLKATADGPTEPFRVSAWVEAAQQRLTEVLGKDRPCVPKLSGSEPAEQVAANPDAPPAPRFDFPEPPQGADTKDVKAVFALLEVPPLLGAPPANETPLDEVTVFSEQAMKEFAPDGSVEEVLEAAKPLPTRIADITPAQWKELKHPTRVAAVKALQEVRAKWAEFASPNGERVLFDGLTGKANDVLKQKIVREQEPLAVLALDLGDTVYTLSDLEEQAAKDESKFWRATFRFALAQAKLRLAFVNEANLALGNVRTDTLPEGSNGWRLVQVTKMTDRKQSTVVKEAQDLLSKLAAECKGTPWEVAAKQWRTVSLGLKWQPKQEDADTTAADAGG